MHLFVQIHTPNRQPILSMLMNRIRLPVHFAASAKIKTLLAHGLRIKEGHLSFILQLNRTVFLPFPYYIVTL